MFKIGDKVSLVIVAYTPSRRSIDLAVPGVVEVKKPAAAAKKATTKKVAPVKKAAPAKKVAPVKKAAPAKKAAAKKA